MLQTWASLLMGGWEGRLSHTHLGLTGLPVMFPSLPHFHCHAPALKVPHMPPLTKQAAPNSSQDPTEPARLANQAEDRLKGQAAQTDLQHDPGKHGNEEGVSA